MTDPIGRELRRALPITMTFYDWLKTHPYTCTFYVPDETSDQACHALVQAVSKLSVCVLGQYKIGHRPFVVENVEAMFAALSPNSIGTVKWRIIYLNELGLSREHSIPGIKNEHTMGALRAGLRKAADNPNLDHPDWQHFLSVFKSTCVSSLGEPISSLIEVKMSKANWPPKGWKKKQ